MRPPTRKPNPELIFDDSVCPNLFLILFNDICSLIYCLLCCVITTCKDYHFVWFVVYRKMNLWSRLLQV